MDMYNLRSRDQSEVRAIGEVGHEWMRREE